MAFEDQDFIIYAGDCKRIIFEVENVDLLKPTTKIRWSVARSVRTTPLITITDESPQAFIDGDWVIIDIQPSDTANLRTGRYYHELELTEENCIYTVSLGMMTVLPVLNTYETEEEIV